MREDIEIARLSALEPISEIAAKAGFDSTCVETYGRYKAKIVGSEGASASRGLLFLVTAMTPTPPGEGKTTMSIALADGLSGLGKRSIVALREPSLGPAFGIKGGATGGGYAQVAPMEDINLHFTGDFHAVTSANNLLAAMIDNHIVQGNALGIDPRTVTWRRCLDVNDRSLRQVITGLGGVSNGIVRETGFDITVASEVMAILCLSSDLKDLKRRLGEVVIGNTYDGALVRVSDLKAVGAMAVLLRDAMSPNLVQTLQGTPALIHGGPFANIAHGCSSLAATRLALSHAECVVTEAGFGADLGAQKFFDIKGRALGLAPNAVCLVVSLRAIRYHAAMCLGIELNEVAIEDLSYGLANVARHLENLTQIWGARVVVAINAFTGDSEHELLAVEAWCAERGQVCARCQGWALGGAEGARDLAKAMLEAADPAPRQHFTYDLGDSLVQKIETIARRVYRARAVEYAPGVLKRLKAMTDAGYGGLDVCIAKTQYSFSDNAKRQGAPEDFVMTVREVSLSAGAGFVVAQMGNIMTMPGLAKRSAAERIDISDDGMIQGLS
ncbi:MAG: formate--tetrahydrofolate ligase [Proteobacteria bacterium]|nr:formate--tetrahydrofolate ligase [Pseudomonadota bacterium]